MIQANRPGVNMPPPKPTGEHKPDMRCPDKKETDKLMADVAGLTIEFILFGLKTVIDKYGK